MRRSCDISWGRWSAYYNPKYLPIQDFSGELKIRDGKIINVERICFPKGWQGPFIFNKQYEP